ncbi:DNA helicase-2/ATP-dependent DNA helicase PcrA [Catenulispora sp. GAS73]|uniref:UvrD-helicase domain-containing protein n=1 Tax=Catenulispora sp. GAS73 TaxID=3156269 RepID=UPI003517BC12
MTEPLTAASLAATPGDALLVIAPPGTGKTELLARRAAVLIERLEPHQKILALTFSNKAKRNLGARLQRELGAIRFRRYIRVRNFHGHAAEILRSHGRTLGLDPAFAMPDARTLTRALETEVGNDWPAREAIARALREAKRGPLDDAEVAALLDDIDLRAANLERGRVAAGILHYDDLLRHAQRLLHVDAIAELYERHYGAVLVDEFQDLSMQQLDLATRSCTASRTFVGDPLQGIFTWAGAQPAEVEATLRQMCGSPHALTVSYRSSPAVLAVVNAAAEELGGEQLAAADPSAWRVGGAACAVEFDSTTEEAEAIVEICESILAQDPDVSIGVIVRASWRRKELDDALDNAHGLPRYRWDLAIDDSVLAERLRDAFRALPATSTVEELRDRVLALIDPADVDTYQQAVEALEMLEELAGPAGPASKALDQLTIRADDRPIEPGVHLLNAHTGKGQQFDWVIVIGLDEGHIPYYLATDNEAVAEEQRVLLVMLSRARHGLILTRAQLHVSKAGKPYPRSPSRWWRLVADPCDTPWSELRQHLAGAE